MGLWAEKEKNEFFFCISPIAIANFSVGWQTLKYLYDILIPARKNREKDVYMSEKSRAEENQVQTLYCNLVSGDVTWVKTSSFVFGKKGANS